MNRGTFAFTPDPVDAEGHIVRSKLFYSPTPSSNATAAAAWHIGRVDCFAEAAPRCAMSSQVVGESREKKFPSETLK